MPPEKRNRYRIKENKSTTAVTKTIDDYEWHLILEIQKVSEEISQASRYGLAVKQSLEPKKQELMMLSRMHQHLRIFQLNR